MNSAIRKAVILVTVWSALISLLLAPVNALRARACSQEARDKLLEEAINAVAGFAPSSSAKELFTRALATRGEAVAGDKKAIFWQELKAKPELARTLVYEADSVQSQKVLKIIRPVLDLYARDWDVAVLQQKAPFVGTFRQCIFIVSTGLLRLVSDEELMGFAAHELAHECFIEELREADRLHCAYAYHLVELKSDLVATLCCLLLKNEPLAIVSGVTRIESFYLNNDSSVLKEYTHPDSSVRRHGIELFLTKINKSPFSSQSSK
jgi:hypothetical protein